MKRSEKGLTVFDVIVVFVIAVIVSTVTFKIFNGIESKKFQTSAAASQIQAEKPIVQVSKEKNIVPCNPYITKEGWEIGTYSLLQVSEPDYESGPDTLVDLRYKKSESYIDSIIIEIKDLSVEIKDNPDGFTDLQICKSDKSEKYIILVNSQNEKYSWDCWIEKWSKIKPKNVTPTL